MTGLSYVSGASDEPLLGMTVGQALDRAAGLWPERPALISPSHGVSWSWREFHDRARRLASGFLALGLQRGERIGCWSLNRPEWALTQFAAAQAGLVFVTINPAYRLHELEYALGKVGCAALVTATRFKSSDFIGLLNTLAPELARSRPGALKAAKLPELRLVIQIGETAPGTLAFEQVAQGDASQFAALDALGGGAAIRRSLQHPVHVRHDGLAQGRDAVASQHPQQRLFHRAGAEADAGGSHLRAGAAVSLLRHGDGQSRRRHFGLGHRLSR